MDVRDLAPGELSAAAAVVAEAFFEDPLMQIIAPDEKRRKAVGPWFFKGALDAGMRWGHVWCPEDVSGAAVWFPPGETSLGLGRMLRVGMAALPLKAGLNGTMRFMKAMPVTEKFHKAVKEPHWYLMAIGVSPSRQGTGVGNALLEAGTSRADAAGVPCYLETGTESNVEFYSKRGFEVKGQEEVLGFTLYGMVRPARS
jgi:ribosomal protein S18 acetylase RimI-like enzyme